MHFKQYPLFGQFLFISSLTTSIFGYCSPQQSSFIENDLGKALARSRAH
jgi:hypothetical protein